MKYKGFAFTLEMGLVLSMVTILLVGGMAVAGVGWYKNYQSDALRDKCNQLDYAVRRYGQNHLAVDTSSEHYDSKGKLHYNMVQTYPASQAKLADLHTLGYLHSSLKIEDFQWKSTSNGVVKDKAVTFYTVNSAKTKYKIEVILPNGTKYVTPGSQSF